VAAGRAGWPVRRPGAEVIVAPEIFRDFPAALVTITAIGFLKKST